MKNKFNEFKDYLVKLIYPNHIKCIFCGDELNNRSYNDTCENCIPTLPFIKYCCDKCGNVLSVDDSGVCSRCKTTNYAFTKARSVFVYNNQILKLMHQLKFGGKKYLSVPIAKFMVDYFNKLEFNIDIVTFVPMLETREKERGFNQAKLLAEEFCKLTNIQCVDCCAKVVENVNQARLTFEERQKNIVDSFAFKNEFKQFIKDKNVLLIDDVFTTGATSNEVCKVLLNNGAKSCYVLTLAHTDLKRKEL